MAEVQALERLLKGGGAQGTAEGLQVIVVQVELLKEDQVTDGGRQLLNVVMAEVEFSELLQAEHARVDPSEFAVRGLEMLEGIREVLGERIVSF